ncbi:flavin reductase [Microbaculum marinum]|uniref:Flavin reductase n=1 Tax=Microbaculum marinum TaxID=1764581 RepID=A0AAW9RS09_9HYPH
MNDPKDFRMALGRFVTGVTVVTAIDPAGRPIGLTANSFNSVSLDPPLVLWSLARKSANLRAFEEASHFAINVLSVDQKEISDRFARPSEDRFAGLEWTPGAGGAPVLGGCAAVFECCSEQRYEGGDHVIFIGRVERFGHEDRVPLAYHAGGYATTAHYAGEFTTGPFSEDYLLYLLARASSLASAEFHAELARIGVPVPMWRILAILSGSDGHPVGEIAARALLKQPTVTKIIDRLQDLGYVTRKPGVGDRRRVLVEISPAGEELVASLILRAREHEDRLLDAQTPAESEILKRVLQQLIRRLAERREGTVSNGDSGIDVPQADDLSPRAGSRT